MELKKNSVDEAKDTGMAMILILLLMTFFWQKYNLIPVAIVVLILVMAWPTLFKPLARIWFGFSHFLGNIVSKVLLSIVFLIVATPIGLVRKIFGADSMRVKSWKNGKDSVMVERNYLFSSKDLERPF